MSTYKLIAVARLALEFVIASISTLLGSHYEWGWIEIEVDYLGIALRSIMSLYSELVSAQAYS